MQKKSTLIATLSRLTLAAVMVAGIGAALPAADDGQVAGLDRQEALRLSRPVSNYGDPEIVNMPVLAGHAYGR